MVRYLVAKTKTKSGLSRFAVRIPKRIRTASALKFAKQTKPRGFQGLYKVVRAKSKKLALKRI